LNLSREREFENCRAGIVGVKLEAAFQLSNRVRFSDSHSNDSGLTRRDDLFEEQVVGRTSTRSRKVSDGRYFETRTHWQHSGPRRSYELSPLRQFERDVSGIFDPEDVSDYFAFEHLSEIMSVAFDDGPRQRLFLLLRVGLDDEDEKKKSDEKTQLSDWDFHDCDDAFQL
jgi:hypothetical protein